MSALTESRLKVIFEDLVTSSPTIKEMKSDITELKADVSILKQDVSILKQDVNILKQDVSILKQDVNILKQDVSILKQDVVFLKEDFHLFKISQENMRSDIKKILELLPINREVHYELTELKTTQKRHENRLDAQESALKKHIESHH